MPRSKEKEGEEAAWTPLMYSPRRPVGCGQLEWAPSHDRLERPRSGREAYSNVIALSGQFCTQDSHSTQSSGLTTLDLPPSSAKTSLGQTSTQVPRTLLFINYRGHLPFNHQHAGSML